MATPSATITLNIDYVLASTLNGATLSGVGRVNAATIIAVGQNVTQWVADQTIMYNSADAFSFNEGDNSFFVIHQNKILFAYTNGALP